MPDFTPRPTVYEGIEMRSRLEAGFAGWLSSEGIQWAYEPQAFGSGEGQYLPDFRVGVQTLWSPTTHGYAYLEVKPTRPRLDALGALAERMLIIRESEPSVPLLLAYKDPEPTLLGIPPTRRGFRSAHWVMTLHGAGVAFDRSAGRLPWPDGYWNGPG